MSGVGREMRSERNDPHPGLRWTQVRDTVRMLNLAVAQVTMSMRDGDDSTSAMGRAFTGLAEEVEVIRAAAEGVITSYSIHYTKLYEAAEADIRKDLPNFSAAKLLGGNIDAFHKNPEHQKRALEVLKGEYRARIGIA